MKRSLLLWSALLPNVALAASPSWFLDGAEVQIAGAVEVPLLRGEETRARPAVAGVISNETRRTERKGTTWSKVGPVFLSLADRTAVPESLATDLGLKVRGSEDDAYVVLPSLQIGDLLLTDVHAEVRGGAVVLGLGTLEGLGAAVLPSQGVVRFAQDPAALALDGGTALVTTRQSAKKYWDHGSKRSEDGVGLVVPLTVGGREGNGLLMLEAEESNLPGVPEGAEVRNVAGVRWVRQTSAVGGVTLDERFWRVDASRKDPDGDRVGWVGADLLYRVDLSLSPDHGIVTVAPAATVKVTDPGPLVLEWARGTFDDGWRKPKFKGKKEVATEPPSEGATAVGRLSAYADALWQSGDAEGALTHYALAADAAGETCSAYLELGRHRLLVGDPKGALEPLERAGTLWEKWERQEVEIKQGLAAEKEKDKKKAKKKWPDAYGEVQPGDCHESWGLLAGAHLALGNTDEIAKLYAEHVDLDPMLPHVYGLALLRGGEADAANGPLRRAVNLGARNDPQTRLALGYANAKAGRAEVLERQHDRLATAALTPSLTDAVVALELERLANGMASADALAARLVETDPDSVAARLGQAWAWHRTGDTAKATAALPAIQALLVAEAARLPGTVRVGAWQAVAAALAGDAAKAKTALDAAAKAGAPDPDHAVAAFLVASIGGDAKAALESLAALQTRHPWVTVPMEWKQAF